MVTRKEGEIAYYLFRVAVVVWSTFSFLDRRNEGGKDEADGQLLMSVLPPSEAASEAVLRSRVDAAETLDQRGFLPQLGVPNEPTFTSGGEICLGQ